MILETPDARYQVIRETETVNLTDDPWANYDPEKVRAALRASAGVLKGVDRDELLVDLRAARGQNRMGRPAE